MCSSKEETIARPERNKIIFITPQYTTILKIESGVLLRLGIRYWLSNAEAKRLFFVRTTLNKKKTEM